MGDALKRVTAVVLSLYCRCIVVVTQARRTGKTRHLENVGLLRCKLDICRSLSLRSR
jgi:hypothetical protein